MILGQLWYGWAPHGAEGINQEQIVAGSGKLGSRASGLTHMVLPWCYFQKTESCGWIERSGVGVAFRRTPTGRDAYGRLGAFFVHALVWQPGTMPAELLPGLWDASLWVTSPPDEPPERLEPIRDEEELGLGEAPAVERDVMTVTLAGLLENLAGSRLSALDLPPARAYGVASRLAAALPAKFGLISFSTHEEPDRADAYDLVAGAPPGPRHAAVGPGTQPASDWTEAARLLLDGREGDANARALVDTIAGQASSLPEFADRMRRWVEIEAESASPEVPLDPRSLAWLVQSPQLVAFLLRGAGARWLARACVVGERIDVLEAVRRADSEGRFVAALEQELLRASPAEAISCLGRIERGLAAQTHGLALTLAESWRGGGLGQLSPQDAVSLARLLASNRAPTSTPAAIVDELTSAPGLAGALACAESLPVEWRANAAAAHPEEVPGQALATAIAYEREFAPTFVRRSGQPGIRRLQAAIADAPMPLALACAERAGAYLASAEDRVNLVWPSIARLPARERLDVLNRYALDIEFEEAWVAATIEALVDTVLGGRDGGRALPRVGGPALNVRLRSTTDRIEAWRGLSVVVGATGELRVEQALRQVSMLADPRESDAALEVVVDAVCERANRTREQWLTAVATVAWGTRGDDEAFALRLARAALRGGGGDRRILARWTVEWVADAIDRKTVSPGVFGDTVLDAVASRLRPPDVEAIDEYASRRPRRSASRKWLKDIEKTAAKQFGRRRRLFHSK
jgi:hypothetical protein